MYWLMEHSIIGAQELKTEFRLCSLNSCEVSFSYSILRGFLIFFF